MAKPFYSMEEVCARLGKDAEAVKKLVRDGALREFRDAGKVFFKAEDVDKLGRGGGKGDSGEIALEPAEEELPRIADSGGTSIIGLVPDEEPKGKKGDTAVPAGGIGVLDEDEVEIDADPMAKTQVTSTVSSDQVSLEGTGSGSGLLDLTREADDTSLGAELLDEIYPGEEEATAPAPKAKRAPEPEPEPEAAEEAEEAGEVVEPVYVTVGDPSEGLFTGMLVGALLLLTVAASVAAGVLQGYVPDYGLWLSNNYLIFLAGGVVVVGLALVIGWLVGRSAATRRVQ